MSPWAANGLGQVERRLPTSTAVSWQWRRIVSSSIRRPAISSSRFEATSNDQLAAAIQTRRMAWGLKEAVEADAEVEPLRREAATRGAERASVERPDQRRSRSD